MKFDIIIKLFLLVLILFISFDNVDARVPEHTIYFEDDFSTEKFWLMAECEEEDANYTPTFCGIDLEDEIYRIIVNGSENVNISFRLKLDSIGWGDYLDYDFSINPIMGKPLCKIHIEAANHDHEFDYLGLYTITLFNDRESNRIQVYNVQPGIFIHHNEKTFESAQFFSLSNLYIEKTSDCGIEFEMERLRIYKKSDSE
jgi:hypothetical protein